MSTLLVDRPRDDASTANLDGEPASPPELRAARAGGAPAVLLGGLGAGLSFAGSWIPSFWGDEAASVMSARRPLGSLLTELSQVDAVHGAYYLFLHFWIQLFGSSELAVRLPSAIAVGFVVAGTVVLAHRLFGPRVAIIAGVICSVLPRITFAGAEGRSYAIAAAIAVWLTILFVSLISSSRPSWRMWALYGATLAIGTYVFLYLALIVVAHGAIILVQRRARPVLVRWVTAVACGLVLASPVIVFGYLERQQLAFLQYRDFAGLGNVLVNQWFGNPVLAVVGWALVVVALANAVIARRRGVLLIAFWLLLPMTVLLVVDKLIVPTYNVRYLTFCAPAAAILMALGIETLRRRWASVVAVGAIVALAAPSYLGQRGPYAKDDGSDFRQAAAEIGRLASPGDAVVFDETAKVSQKPRLALRLYPENFVGLSDVTLVSSFLDQPGLWDRVAPVAAVGDRLATTRTVWALEQKGTTTPRDISELTALGFAVVQSFAINRTTIYQLSREPAQ